VIGAEGEFQAFGIGAHWTSTPSTAGRSARAVGNIQHRAHANATDADVPAAGNPRGYAWARSMPHQHGCGHHHDDPSCVPLNRLGIGVANLRDRLLRSARPIATSARSRRSRASTSRSTRSVPGRAMSASRSRRMARGEISGSSLPNSSHHDGELEREPDDDDLLVGRQLPAHQRPVQCEGSLSRTVVPLGLGLEFNGAVRATDYSTAGYVTTWKLGATWQPIPRYSLPRGAVARYPGAEPQRTVPGRLTEQRFRAQPDLYY